MELRFRFGININKCRQQLHPLFIVIIIILSLSFVTETTALSTYKTIDAKDLTLTQREKTLLDKLKAEMSPSLSEDYMKEDIYLIAWLRAKNLDYNRAKEMLQTNLNWRKKNGMDGKIHEEDWSDMQDVFPYFLEGRDKFKRPMLYVDVGGVDFRRISLAGKMPRAGRYLDKMIDEACGLVRELGRKHGNITRGNLCINMDGYNLVDHGCPNCVPLLVNLIVSYGNHWPSCADKIVLFNTPALFEPVLHLMKNLMQSQPDTKRALTVFGTNRKQYRDELSREFDFDDLPPSIGGTKIYKGMEFSF